MQGETFTHMFLLWGLFEVLILIRKAEQRKILIRLRSGSLTLSGIAFGFRFRCACLEVDGLIKLMIVAIIPLWPFQGSRGTCCFCWFRHVVPSSL